MRNVHLNKLGTPEFQRDLDCNMALIDGWLAAQQYVSWVGYIFMPSGRRLQWSPNEDSSSKSEG